jgi:dUTPase
MCDFYYRLELLPTEEGREFYKPVVGRSNDNAGFDLVVPADTVLGSQVTLLKLGCKARLVKCYADEMEEDVHFWLASRSSIWKSGVMMANNMGVIDKTHRGELMGAVWSYNDTVQIQKGTRLFQVLAPDMGWIKEVRIVESLSNTVRGEGGFGSTGLTGI